MPATTSGPDMMLGAPEQFTLTPTTSFGVTKRAHESRSSRVAGERAHAFGEHVAYYLRVDLGGGLIDAARGGDANDLAAVRTGHAGVGGGFEAGDNLILRDFVALLSR